MVQISVSLHSGPKINLEKILEKLNKANADFLHIDVMDSNFVNEIDFGENLVKEIGQYSEIPLDIHMMVEKPERLISNYAFPTTQIIGVHVEATKHIHRAIAMIKSLNKKAEVVLNPGTPISIVKPIFNLVDQIMIMSVDPGFGGSTFINSTVNRVKKLDNLRKKYNYHYKIEVDGGINDQNLKDLVKVGLDRAVSGSFIFNGDINNQITKLKNI